MFSVSNSKFEPVKELDLTIGERIAIARRRQRLNQDVLAKYIGVSELTVRRWEDGQCRPPFDKVDAIAKITHCDLRFFSRQAQYAPTEINLDGSELCLDAPQPFSNFSVAPAKAWDDFWR